MKTLPIGTISHGTMRAEDLIPAFLDALESVDKDRAESMRSELEELTSRDDREDFLNEDLWNALDSYCPPYCYFGSHPGDGSDYGCWISHESIDEGIESGKILKVNSLAEVAKDYTGYVVEADREEYTSLYKAKSGKFEQIWSIV